MRTPIRSTRPLTSSLASLPTAAAICAALALASSGTATAADFFWDGDADPTGNDILTGAGLGGAGNWLGGATWYNSVTDVLWPNTTPSADRAIFTGTGGAVATGGVVFVNALRFDANGFSITNGGTAANTLTLSGPLPTVTVNSTHSAAITAVIAGSGGLVKNGTGTLTLSAGNTFTGDVLVEGGTLEFNGVAASSDQTAFGAGAKAIILTNNATLALVGSNDANPNAAGGKGIEIGSGGGTLSIPTGRNIQLDDGTANGSVRNQLAGAGTLTKTGEGTLILGRDYAATFTGDVVVNRGLLDVRAANAAGNVGTITVDGTAGASRANFNATGGFTLNNSIVLQNGGVLSTQGANHNLANNKTITIGTGTSRIRTDDASSATIGTTNRTFVLNGALNGTGTLEVTGTTASNRSVLAISNAAGNFSGTIVIDRGVSVENFARWNGTTATNTGKTIGTALIRFDALANGSASNTLDGQLDLRDAGTGNNQTFNYGNNVEVAGSNGIIQVGTNTQAAITSTGGRFVLGTLSMAAGRTITANSTNGYSLEFAGVTTLAGDATFAGSSNLTLTGGISGGGNITKTGAGVLNIGTFAGTTYSGTTTINGGGIVYDSPASIPGAGANVTLASGTWIGANFAVTQENLINRLVPTANPVGIAIGEGTTANLDLSGFAAARLGAVGTVTYTGTLTRGSTDYLLGGGGGTLILPGTNVITGTAALDIGAGGSPAGVVALDGSNDFTGTITLSGGQLLRPATNASLGNVANTINSLGGGIQLKAGAGFDIFAARTITFGAGGFILDTNGNDLSTTVAIGNTGTGGFTKTGAGKLTLTQASTFAGSTTISGGTLSVSADNMLGTASPVQFLSGGELEVTGTFTIPSTRVFNFGSGGGVVNVTEGNTLTLASSTTGAGLFVKDGSGTLAITADPNNNTAGFLVNRGLLIMQNASGSTDGPFVINDTATLRVTVADKLGDAHSVTVNSGGTYDIRANDTISQLLGSGTVTNGGAAGATLTVNSATNATFSGVMQNGASALGFTKAGANVVTLTGANTQTGTTTINTGQLRVEGATARLNGGGLIIIGDNNGNDESLVIGSNADVVSGTLDRIGDTSEVDFRGSTLVTINGPALGSGGFVETIGNIDFRDGVGTFALNPAVGAELQVNAATLTRELGTGTGVIVGTNLGGTGANSSRVLLASTSGILVGSGGTGSQASIVPFVIGGSSATAAPTTFLRYDATNGLTPLGNSDYESTIAGSTGRNVSVAGGETVSAETLINALRVTGGTTTVAAPVTIDSGAILFTGTAAIDGTGSISAGARPLIISAAGDDTAITATVNADLVTGSGLAVGDAGNIGHTIVLGGDNRIVGGVTINGGALRAGSDNALGLQGGLLNDLTLKAGNSGTGGALSSVFQLGGNDISVVFNGNDRLQGSTRIQNASATPGTLTIVTNAASGSNDGIIEDGTGGGALSLIKRGNATLTLEQTNSYTGTTEILGGTVQLTTANGRFSGTSGITIAGGGILNLNNTNTANQGDRLNNAAAVTMRGGQFQFDNNQNTVNYAETVGALNSASGSNQVITDFAASGQTSALTFASLNVSAGSALNFTNFGTTGDIAIGESGTRNRVILTAKPTLSNGIIGGNVYHTKNFVTATTFDPVDFASYDLDTDGTGADIESGIVAFTGYITTDEATWANTSVVRPAASAVLTASRSVHALKLDNGIDLTIGAGQTLNVISGGIIYNPNSTTASTSTISEGKLTAGGTAMGELAIRVDGNLNAATLAISSEIADNGTGAVSLLKSGPDALTLSGTNTYTGRTTIVEGVVNITTDENLGAAPAAAAPSHLRLHGGALNLAAGTATLSANRGIEVSGGIGTLSASAGANLIYNGAIATSPEGGFTIAGNVDMALSGPLSLGRSFRISGSGTVADVSTVSLNGAVNNIGESLQVGTDAPGTSSLTYGVAGGTLNVGTVNPNGSNLDVGVRTVNTNADVIVSATADLSGSALLSATVDRVRVGVVTAANSPDTSVRGVLTLPPDTNIVALTEVSVSDSLNAGLGGATSSIKFGSGTSNLTTPVMTIGGRKGDARTEVAVGGIVNLAGFVPGSMDLRIAYNNIDATGVSSAAAADFSGGTLNADLDELIVGFKNGNGGGAGGANGTLNLGSANNAITANQIRLGEYSGGSSGTAAGIINIGGGSLTVNNDVSLGLYGGAGTTGGAAGTLNITGGTVSVGGNIVTSNSARATATLNLNGGSLDMTGGSINVDAFNAQTGILRNVSQVFNGDGATPAALTKTGTAALEIQGANTYTGDTMVDGGSVFVNGSVSGAVTTAATTTLGGDGLIGGAVNIGSLGTLSPGGTLSAAQTIGSLDVGGLLTMGNNSTLKLDLNGLTAGAGYDQVNAGSVSLGSDVSLSLSMGFTPDTSVDTFYFILNRADAGAFGANTFAGLNEGSFVDLGNGLTGQLTYLANWTGDAATSSFTGGNDVAVLVPEPGALTTLFGALGVLASLGRFRRRSIRG
jgi:fibronectin-binding autotransporter adhesin